ncbi:MAG TPA: hypothetical protein VFD69_10365 [Vicinamibacterales bacterium]|nr:hypothetical protein [Vicinamibacterales bacterium]
MHINRHVVHALATAVAVAWAAAAAAQARPDFSGEWVLNRQGSTLPPPVSNVESGVVRIEHREPSFAFHRTYVMAGTPREAGFTRRTDGAETSETGPQGLTTVSTLRWDGTALVLAMRIKGPGFEATNDVRYELIEGGRRLRAAEQGRRPRGNHDAVWIYDRR